MLVKTDLKLFQSMARLLNNSDYQNITEWLLFNLHKLDRDSRRANGDSLLWNQGARQVLEELIEYSEHSRTYLEALKERS